MELSNYDIVCEFLLGEIKLKARILGDSPDIDDVEIKLRELSELREALKALRKLLKETKN